MINDYYERSSRATGGVNNLTNPLGPLVSTAKYVPNGSFNILNALPKGIQGVVQVKGSVPEDAKDKIESLIQPPSDKINIILTDSENQMVSTLNSAVNKQLIQQFYEAYYSPTGLEDSTFRLGKVQSSIANVHELYKDGVTGVIASTPDAAWRANVNYGFEVDEGLGNASYKFMSLAFPPFVSTKADTPYNSVVPVAPTTNVNSYIVDHTFDMTNLLYKGNTATVRKPGFKQVNDNINTLQFLFNRAFGVESTYINEWDLSLYMQEGIVSILKKDMPEEGPDAQKDKYQYVTTLTYGLGTDAPIEKNLSHLGQEAADMDILEITPFASWNMAVSTRRAVDNITLNFPANQMSYEISKYPLSSYWVAPENGRLLADLPYQKYFPNAKRVDPDTGELVDYPHWETVHTDMNVPQYVDDITAYRSGLGVWASENDVRSKLGRVPYYSAKNLHGPDLSHSTAAFEHILKHADARDAILSGWNALDEAARPYVGNNEISNGYKGANAYSFLPFWRQFFFNSGDGMEDVDQYWQEVQGSDDAEKSILEAIDDIWRMSNSDNAGFNSFLPAEDAPDAMKKHKNRARTKSSPLTANYSYGEDDDDDYGNIKFSVPIVGTIEVPHTKLLNMFINRNKKKSKANDKKKAQENSFVSNTFAQVGGLPKATVPPADSNKPEDATSTGNPTVEDNNTADPLSQSSQVETYEIPDDENMADAISYADGVNNHSPFLYGGPHGEFYSPLTLEGVTEMGNESLETVPTMDINDIYNYRKSVGDKEGFVEGAIDSKNFKFGHYLASRITMGMSERNAAYNLMQKDIDPDIVMPFEGSYNSQHKTSREACWCIRFCFGWGRWKHCWSIHIPTRFIILESRRSWSWPFLRLFGKWENKYWYNYWRNNYVYVNKTIKLSEIQRDFKDEIYAIVPQYRGYRLNEPNQTNIWNYGWGQRNWADWDTNMYNSTKGHNESSAGMDHNYCCDNNGHMRYLVGEIDGSQPEGFDSIWGPMCTEHYEGSLHVPTSSVPWRHWSGSDPNQSKIVACYNREDSEFDIVKRNMFAYVPGNGRSSGLFTVSLPIVRNGRMPTVNDDNIIELVTVAANVERDVMLRPYWIWTLQWHWGSYLWGHTCHHWWRSCHFCGWHTSYYLYPCWHLVRYILPRQTYSLYVYPEKVKNIIPGKGIVRSLYYSNYLNNRDRIKASNNIIERYRINQRESNIDLTHYWPFSNNFRLWYGKDGFWQKPGYSNGYDAYSRVVTSRGIYFGDVMQNYINNGKVVTRVGDGFRYLYKSHGITWNRYIHDWDIGCYLYDSNTSQNDIFSWGSHNGIDPRLRSRYYIAANTGRVDDAPLTKFIREMVYTPAALQYNVNGVRKYALFDQVDAFNVFIDTCTVQLAWLNQIYQYARTYLTDQNIYTLYKNVTDKKIRDIITCASISEATASETTKASDTYLTGSYSEDVNYYDALLIIEKAFANAGPSDNTIAALVADRSTDILRIQKKAIELRDRFISCRDANSKDGLTTNFRDLSTTHSSRGWDVLEDFSKLITNTKLLLDNMNGAKAKMYDAAGNVAIDSGRHCTIARPDGTNLTTITFDLINNPATLVWAYLNVLYQARKFFVNKRLDKVQGSYWIMRSLERVMTFQDAKNSASTLKELPIDGNPELSKNKNMEIKFVQGRMSLTELSTQTGFDLQVDNTNAVWCKVKYLSNPNPTNSLKWQDGKYDGKEIVYVPDSRKFAYKPADGYYYVMSQTITQLTKDLNKEYADDLASIQLNAYEISDRILTTSVGGKITAEEVRACTERITSPIVPPPEGFDSQGNETDEHFEQRIKKDIATFTNNVILLRDYKEYLNYYVYGVQTDGSDTAPYDTNSFAYMPLLSSIYKTRLANYYKEFFDKKISELLYKVYIVWDPSGVGSALSENEVDKTLGGTRNHFIDPFQAEQTRNGSYLQLTDAYGNVNTIEREVDAGITFGVADSLNIGTIVNNLPLLKSMTATELVCNTKQDADYWRIQIPAAMDIPVELLKNKPILVADYEYELMRKEFSGMVVPTPQTALVGLSNNALSPIHEYDLDKLTAATTFAIGEAPSLHTLGMDDARMEDSEKHFG